MAKKGPKKKIIPPQHQKRQPGREKIMTPRPEFVSKNYRAAGKLENKVALITGGDSGIGRSAAVLFAKEGADVAICFLEETQDALETKEAIEAEGKRCLMMAGDIGSKQFCKKFVDATVKKLGKLDIVVNNAAEQHPLENLTEISEQQLEKTFRTNIFSYFFITQAAMPHLKEGASIINTTSVTAYRGSAHLVDYASTKGAIVSFTRSLASQLAPKKIRVNGVAPGPIWTPLIPASFSAEEVSKFGSDVPLGRPGQPSECGPAFVFLACEDSSYITGQVIHPNGGEIVNA